MDYLLSLLGRKAFADLTTVQGRYLLRSQISEIVNQLVNGEMDEKDTPGKAPQHHVGGGAPLVTNVYFTQFIVQ
jgi:flagellar basal body-associated protein FliL